VGLDIEYSAVKAVSGDRRMTFPSVVGTPDRARFSLNGGTSVVLIEPEHIQGHYPISPESEVTI